MSAWFRDRPAGLGGSAETSAGVKILLQFAQRTGRSKNSIGTINASRQFGQIA
jgi:hypothetical protein